MVDFGIDSYTTLANTEGTYSMNDQIRLDRMVVKPKLPSNFKLLRVGDLLIITKWTGFGWKQITPEEFARVKRDHDLE